LSDFQIWRRPRELFPPVNFI